MVLGSAEKEFQSLACPALNLHKEPKPCLPQREHSWYIFSEINDAFQEHFWSLLFSH